MFVKLLRCLYLFACEFMWFGLGGIAGFGFGFGCMARLLDLWLGLWACWIVDWLISD